ncbi:hypothetical protein INR49_001589 [Caranx melampygus]|nr:hypothetical protein INR49_001589 [Caranx melampygus]
MWSKAAVYLKKQEGSIKYSANYFLILALYLELHTLTLKSSEGKTRSEGRVTVFGVLLDETAEEMAAAVLYTVIIGAITAATCQQVVVQPKVYSSPGQTVNLSCVFTDATGVLISQVTWIYETEGRRISIAAFAPNNAPSYPESPLKDKVSFSPSPPVLTSPSIQIRDVKKTDEGNYICSFATIDGNRENVTNLEMLGKSLT